MMQSPRQPLFFRGKAQDLLPWLEALKAAEAPRIPQVADGAQDIDPAQPHYVPGLSASVVAAHG